MTNQEVLEKFEQYLASRTYAENTKISYLRSVDEFLNIVGVNYAKFDDEHKIRYDEFLASSNFSLVTRNVKISSVITFFKFLHVKKIHKNDLYTMFQLERNAKAESKPHKVPTLDDLSTIQDYVVNLPESFMNQRKKIMMLLFIYTGVRRDELANLKWKNVQIDEEKIYIDKAKRNEFRHVYLNELLINELSVWKKMCEDNRLDSEFIVVTKKNKQISNREINDITKRIMKKLNMDYTPHCIRKGCATMMYVKYDLNQIQQLLGHASRATTELYVKPEFEENMAKNNILTRTT